MVAWCTGEQMPQQPPLLGRCPTDLESSVPTAYIQPGQLDLLSSSPFIPGVSWTDRARGFAGTGWNALLGNRFSHIPHVAGHGVMLQLECATPLCHAILSEASSPYILIRKVCDGRNVNHCRARVELEGRLWFLDTS